MLQEVLFKLLRVGLGLDAEAREVIAGQPDWRAVYAEAAAQGVLAVAWSGVERLMAEGRLSAEQLPSREVKIAWALNAERIEKRYMRQRALSSELAAIYAEQGIDTFVLKGFAVSRYYPTPSHRECGDLDCFLGDDYERGNQVAEQAGASVERDFYKHSHISYRGLMVENHQFCTAIRGEQRRKSFERHLQQLLHSAPRVYAEGTKLILPSADFNALFLTNHSLEHFLSEGIRLRHILDWALLLHHEQMSIDWTIFYEQCERRGLTIFANTMNSLAERYVGVELRHPSIQRDERYIERVLEDVHCTSQAIFNRKVSAMQARMLLVKNRLSAMWKYHKIYRRSMLWDVARLAWGLIAERTPKL